MIEITVNENLLLENWIKDLREHPELQGRDWLRNKNNTYCCLGRLAEVSKLGKWNYDDNNSLQIMDLSQTSRTFLLG